MDVRSLRKRLNLTQAEFASRIGKTRTYVTKLESGKIALSDELSNLIQETFGLPSDWMDEKTAGGESVADRIKHLRLQRHLSQKDFAEDCSCSRNMISLIERGKAQPSGKLLQTIADKMWVSINWLRTGNGQMERKELTEIYELLRSDPSFRAAVRGFLARLD